MRQIDVTTPHFSLPFRFGSINGAAYVNEQDTSDDVLDSARTVLWWPLEQRDDLPDFGTLDIAFKLTTDESLEMTIKAALQQWEPRAVIDIEERPEVDELVRDFIATVKTLAE
jgi:phage baseplate assembly protein W